MALLPVCVCSVLSCIWLSAIPWIPCQAPLSMDFFGQEYWSGLPFPIPGDFLDPGIKPSTLASSALAVRFFTTRATWEAQRSGCCFGPETKPGSTAWKAVMFTTIPPTKHKLLFSCYVLYNSLQPHALKPTRWLCPWGFPGKNTGVDCYFLLQGIFSIQG